ncbi:MAG: hypothetical protein O7F17_03965 [Planctomycetota bacterium]|nr:hypothetical protein [Planctomycetota bacterium]MCH8164183.1 hypothetical protein [Planctomycetota bacterium]MCZ6492696.1 hypothetical protein [Planctomycetota bacterium]MCZ6543270.1 hypothetical protein [Planctomycetota bacterium]MCZ6810925.1 hypothetical protein [Planctomycetota bacterium]
MTHIPALGPADAALRADAPSRFSEMKTEDFIRIIFAELSNQDPFSPNDSGALLDQLNSIRSIESDIKLVSRLDALVFQNQLGAAANLIGKFVDGLTADNQRVSGIVVSVVRHGDSVNLELDNGWQVPINSVETIHDMTGESAP